MKYVVQHSVTCIYIHSSQYIPNQRISSSNCTNTQYSTQGGKQALRLRTWMEKWMQSTWKGSTYINQSCIVTTSHAAIVVTDGIQPITIQTRATLMGQETCQIKVVNGKINICLKLVFQNTTVGESLQVNNQNFRQSPKIQFLTRWAMLLAARAIPWKWEFNKVLESYHHKHYCTTNRRGSKKQEDSCF